MSFNISPKANENYLAKFVTLTNLSKHPQADRLQVSVIDGCSVITGMDAKLGDLVVFFPLECSINSDFLSYTNSYEDKESNLDKTKKGFFNKHGRVRALKLRGQASQGYIVPILVFLDWVQQTIDSKVGLSSVVSGQEFSHYGETQIVRKYYIPKVHDTSEKQAKSKNKKTVKKFNRVIENQFNFHESTCQLGKNIHRVNPNDLVSITAKLHGTSAVISKVLVNKKLTLWQKILKKLGADVSSTEYGSVYSSRSVIKNKSLNPEQTKGYYGVDIWGVVAKELEDYLLEGMTIYGEIVGYTQAGNYIQKDYDYGCAVGEHKFYAYRITHTTPSGVVTEWSAKQVQDWCREKGLLAVPELYYGYAKDLFLDVSQDEAWHENVLSRLKDKYLEGLDPLCNNKVPDEGIVLRVESTTLFNAKLKSHAFYERESKALDAGEVDIESQESVNT